MVVSLPEKNPRSEFAIFLGLVPGIADNTVVKTVEFRSQALAILLCWDGAGCRDSRQAGSAKLQNKTIKII